MIIADANLLVYRTVQGPRTETAKLARRRDGEWKSPRLWRVEFRNAVLKHVRAGHLTLAEALASYEFARSLIARDEPEGDPRSVLEIALAYGISAYDAEYVAVARALGVRVVSTDARLIKAVPEYVVSLESFAAGG